MMRSRWLVLFLLVPLLGACRGRVPDQVRNDEGIVRNDGAVVRNDGETARNEDVRSVFSPEFSAAPIPPEVEARMRGCSYPDGARIALADLRYLRLSYIDFDGAPQTGEMVCNKAIAGDLCEIFRALYEARYPIRSIRLIDDFGGSDEASMLADNSSCFNYRARTGQTRLSNHALGLAVDINPLENPFVSRAGRVSPAGAEAYADRAADFPHKIDREDLCYKLFREHGFSWGGAWLSAKDYQHFEKP